MPPKPIRPRRLLHSISVASMAAVSTIVGCATGEPLEIKKVDAVVQPPANVALYLKIAREDGQPVSLVANDFKVYEDGKLIPSKKIKRALLPVKYAVDRVVFVVVDLSGPLVDSEYLSTLHDAVAAFAERVGKDVRMAVSVFDGDGMVPFVRFEDPSAKAGLLAMRKFRPRSRTIDLWGTFITALDDLDQTMKQSAAPHQHGTLVLITDRRDKAGRHSPDEALERVKKSGADVYVIGIGEAIDRDALEPLGKTGALFAPEPRDLDKPFMELSDRVEAQLGRDYLFSYCSPQKGGKRKHELEVRIANARWRGTVEHEFSTRGFTNDPCDPMLKPAFKTASGGEESAAPAEDDSGSEGAKPKPKKKKKGKSAADGEENPES